MGARFTSEFSVFRNGWMDCIGAFSCCFMLILLCNRQNMAAHEAYWLMGVPVINYGGMLAILCFEASCVII